MPPKFATSLAWEQANLLMQPALIRVIDNIRKHLDESAWTGTYENVMRFPPGTSPNDQHQVQDLQAALTTATPDQAAEIQHRLDHLPQPYLGYELCLSKGDRQVRVDLWELCYQVCFRNYQPAEALADAQSVEIDETLVDGNNELDWNQLEHKAQQAVSAVFAQLAP